MKDNKKISLIVPTYNNAALISTALDSVIVQTHKNFEIIVIDDGSTDATSKIVHQYANRYPNNVRYFYQENQGVSSARNLGLSVARGDYICFLDSDDVLLSNESLSNRARFLDQFSDVDVVFSDMKVYYSGGRTGFWLKNTKFLIFFQENIVCQKGFFYIFNKNFYKKYFIFSPFPICVQTIMFRKRVLADLRFPDSISVGEDVYFFYSLIRKISCGYIDDPLAVYRNDLSSLTKNVEGYYLNNIKLFNLLIKEEPEISIKGQLRRQLANSYFELSYFFRKNSNCNAGIRNASMSILLNPLVGKYYHNLMALLIRRCGLDS